MLHHTIAWLRGKSRVKGVFGGPASELQLDASRRLTSSSKMMCKNSLLSQRSSYTALTAIAPSAPTTRDVHKLAKHMTGYQRWVASIKAGMPGGGEDFLLSLPSLPLAWNIKSL